MAEYKHAVDITIDAVRGLSGQSPFAMFQRNGAFYVASERGFGMVSQGLPT